MGETGNLNLLAIAVKEPMLVISERYSRGGGKYCRGETTPESRARRENELMNLIVCQSATPSLDEMAGKGIDTRATTLIGSWAGIKTSPHCP